MKGRAAAAALAMGLVLSGCSQPPSTIRATGRVVADDLTLQAPALDVPRIDLNAGFVSPPGTAPRWSAVPALLSLGSVQSVEAVEARLGQQVKAGDILLRFDDDALVAQAGIAKADRALAKTQIGVIDAAIDTTHDREEELEENRVKVTDGIAKATDARADLVDKRAQARQTARTLPKQLATVQRNLKGLNRKLAEVEARLGQVTAALAALPPDAPPEVRQPLLTAQRQLTAARKGLRAGIAKLTAARRQLRSAIARVKQGIPQLTKGIATIDDRLAEARDALERIDDGRAKIREARADLKRTRTLAVIAAADNTAVNRAATARAQAVVKAPADGVVSSIARVGDVLAPGATAAMIARPAAVVSTWLAPEVVSRVCLGDAAVLSTDSPTTAEPSGSVTRILPEAAYPPSYHTTSDVHLTRAVAVEVTFDTALPPGAPVDIQITPCRTTR